MRILRLVDKYRFGIVPHVARIVPHVARYSASRRPVHLRASCQKQSPAACAYVPLGKYFDDDL